MAPCPLFSLRYPVHDTTKSNPEGDCITLGVIVKQGPDLPGFGLFRLGLTHSALLLGKLDTCSFQLVLHLRHIGGFDVSCR